MRTKPSPSSKSLLYSTASSVPPLAMMLAAFSMAVAPSPALAQRPIGVDVSSYQGSGINWSSVKSDGVSFAWAKATEGTTITDADFSINISHAKAAGVYIGAYHFAHPDNTSPASESSHFWSVANGSIADDGKTFMPMLDMEVFSGIVGASSYSDWANQFCSTIKSDASAKGVKINPFIYTSACSACEFNSSVAQWFADIADYNGENVYTGTPWSTCTSCEAWGAGVWNVWQVSSTASISGISGGVDLDGYNGTLAGLVATSVATGAGVSPGESLGGAFIGGIGSCSWAANRLDLIGVGTDGGLYHKWWDGSAWQPSKTGGWQNLGLGTGFHGDVGAVSWGANRIDFFVLGANNHCYHGWYDISAGGWNGMQDLGGVFATTTGFGAASWASGRLDIFGVGTVASNLYHASYTSAGWSGWENLGGTLTATPGAVSWGPNRIDVFGRGTDGACHQDFWSGSAWSGFVNLGGGFINYGMGAASMGANELSIFGLGTGGGGDLYEKDFNGIWGAWTDINTDVSTSTPSAVSWGPGRLDIFVRGSDNACHHLFYQ